MKFKHFILTRYNLGIYDKDNPYFKTVGNPDEWMRHRAKLFDKCLISLFEQTNKNFTWIIAVDPISLGTIKINEKYVNVKFITEQPHIWLRKQYPGAEWLITSRLDNDDILHPDYVDAIQSKFREVNEIIDIDYEVVDNATGLKYPSNRTKPNSPFLSLIEPWGNTIMTAMGKAHSIMSDIYPARKLGVFAQQVIHDRNVLNKIPK